MTAEEIIAHVASLIGGEPDGSGFPNVRAALENPAFEVAIAPCVRPIAPFEIEGETVICGTLEVPEDHSEPDGRQISLNWIVYKAHSLSPAPDPVVYLHGGPGGGTVRTVFLVTRFFDHLRQRRDIISFDQRGVDASAPDMDCFGTVAENLDASVRSFAGEGVPDLPETFTRGCLEELAGRGIDITKYNTTQNALDVGALMQAMGYPEYNIYGVSYGTKLTLEVMRQEVSGVRSIILDGVAPPHVPTYNTLIAPHANALVNTFAPCERDPVCSEAYPDITDRFFALLDQLNEEPVDVLGQPFSGEVLFGYLDGRNARRSNEPNKISTYLPLMVTQLEEGDVTLATQMMAGQIPPKTTSDSVVAHAQASGIGGNELALVKGIAMSSQVIDLNQQQVQTSIIQLESDLALAASGLDVAELFDDLLGEAIKGLATREERLEAGRDYLNLRFEHPDPLKLSALVNDHFSGVTADQILALIEAMDADDVARAFELVGLDNQALEDAVEGEFEVMLYACQEDFVGGHNSLEGFFAESARTPFSKAFLAEALSPPPSIFPVCEKVFEPVPRDNWLEPVESDRQVLILNGEIDVQTDFSWGAQAAETLPNGRNLVFPETGHGTILFSQCARDITAAYIENPDGDLDTSCIKRLRPPVMLPDGTMHPLPL